MPTMSTASVFFSLLFLTIWTHRPSEAFNVKMAFCNQTLIPHVTDLDLNRFSGRWYMSQVSTIGPTQLPNNWTSAALDIFRTVLPVDNEGRENVDFLVVRRTMATNCACTFRDVNLCQTAVPGTCSLSYSAGFLPPGTALPPGYYVMWSNYHVLVTDYDTTAVLLFEPVVNGGSAMMFSEFQILVRNKGAQPNTTLVQETMAGFCMGQFSDPASAFYVQVPNDSNLACMAPRQLPQVANAVR